MERVLIIYHSADLDGLCSAAIAEKAMQSKTNPVPITLIGMDYPLTREAEEKVLRASNDALVVIVDFCLTKATMLRMQELSESMVWLDHHLSSIKEMADTGVKFDGIQDISKAACELTWDYFFGHMGMLPQVQLLGMYDTWRYKNPTDAEAGYAEHVLPFQLYARTKLQSVPDFGKWDFFQGDFLTTYEKGASWIDFGKAIVSYRKADLTKRGRLGKILDVYLDRQVEGIPTAILGDHESALPIPCLGKMFVINANDFTSAVADHLSEDEAASIVGVLCYCDSGPGQVKIGMYFDHNHKSPYVKDWGKVCKAYGGGGHPGAAGATISTVSISDDAVILF